MKSLGQYFTTNKMLQDFVYSSAKNRGLLLEPSFGAGHLLVPFLEQNPDYNMVCCEIDTTIVPVVNFNFNQTVMLGDFLKVPFGEQRFDTIVGNPPYVKGVRNLYLGFIEKCFNLLAPNGEMIFIVPSDLFKVTSAMKLIKEMWNTGTFTDILFPHDEKLFSNASVDVVVFRFVRGGVRESVCNLNGRDATIAFDGSYIHFGDVSGQPIHDIFSVHVGLVTGNEAVFKQPFGNVKVLNTHGGTHDYILVDTYPCGNPVIDAHLVAHKDELLTRKIRKFSEKNWFEWGALRNVEIMMSGGKECVFVKTLTRDKVVAFKSGLQLFGAGLLCMHPLVDGLDLDKVVAHLNGEAFRKEFVFAGRFKIGQKQLQNITL